jgi:hypothetical protein
MLHNKVVTPLQTLLIKWWKKLDGTFTPTYGELKLLYFQQSVGFKTDKTHTPSLVNKIVNKILYRLN